MKGTSENLSERRREKSKTTEDHKELNTGVMRSESDAEVPRWRHTETHI